MKRRFIALLCAAIVVCGGRVLAQISELGTSVLSPSIGVLQAARADNDDDLFAEVVDQVLATPGPFVAATVADNPALRFIIEANRIDKQVGAPANGKGSTSLVSSGSVPRLLGFAVETGALTRSESGSSVTFQTNPVGLVSALAGYVPDLTDSATRNTLSVLRRFNVTATFDASRENDQRFTGSYRQLSSASAQIYIYNHRDPTDPKWGSMWAGFSERVGKALPDAVTALQLGLEAQPAYRSLREETRQRLIAATSDVEIETAILDHAARLKPLIPAGPAAEIITAWTAYLRAQEREYQAIARSPILTFEYQVARPPIQDAPADVVSNVTHLAGSDLSTARLIFARAFLGASDMTINSSVSFFGRQLEGGGGVRDWQVGGKLDFPLNGVAGFSRSQLTIGALYIRMRQPPLGFPVVVEGVPLEQTGGLKFLQGRLRVPMGDTGISVPLSVTYASRTEFLKGESDVRGSIGFTFDFDKLEGAAVR